MLTVDAQYRARLTVDRFLVEEDFATRTDFAALLIEGDAVVDSFPEYPFELGENPRQALGIVPYVRAGARAAVDALPGIRTPIIKPVKRLRSDTIDGDEGPVQKPVWQAAVIPVIDDYVKRNVAKGFSEAEVRGWIKFLRERSDYWTRKQITLRIPSAAGPPEVRPEALK